VTPHVTMPAIAVIRDAMARPFVLGVPPGCGVLYP
jgi:hypothetical protein